MSPEMEWDVYMDYPGLKYPTYSTLASLPFFNLQNGSQTLITFRATRQLKYLDKNENFNFICI